MFSHVLSNNLIVLLHPHVTYCILLWINFNGLKKSRKEVGTRNGLAMKELLVIKKKRF
jgi:hypothetical protein